MFLLCICIELIYSVKTTSIITHIGMCTGTVVQTYPNTLSFAEISFTGLCTYFTQIGQ